MIFSVVLPGRLVDSECCCLSVENWGKRMCLVPLIPPFSPAKWRRLCPVGDLLYRNNSCILNTCRSAQKAQFDFLPPSHSQSGAWSEFLPARAWSLLILPTQLYSVLMGKVMVISSSGSTVGLSGFRVFCIYVSICCGFHSC